MKKLGICLLLSGCLWVNGSEAGERHHSTSDATVYIQLPVEAEADQAFRQLMLERKYERQLQLDQDRREQINWQRQQYEVERSYRWQQTEQQRQQQLDEQDDREFAAHQRWLKSEGLD